MAEIRREIDYVECTEGTSNKWYMGIDLGPAVGLGVVAYGAIGKIQSFAICSRGDVGKKLAEKRSPKKRYTDEKFGNGWGMGSGFAGKIEDHLIAELRAKGLYEAGDKVQITMGPNGQGLMNLTLAKAIDPQERKAAAANPPPTPQPIDRKVFGDW